MASNHLLELQKEIKEEEEEIFADINSLINGRGSTLFSSLDEPDTEAIRETDLEPHSTYEQAQPHIHRLLFTEKDFFSSSDELNEATYHENDDPNGAQDEQVTSSTCNRQSNLADYEDIQAVIQQVTNNLPKPCVFFLEGNCRRSDCKYSHDLSNITCKYWIEGFCFKGEMCPFLHSYTPASVQDPSLLDEDALKALKKELNPTFVIESEADFPSLPLDAPATALNDSTKSSINTDSMTNTIKHQILSSNPAVVFKTVKRKRKRG